MSHLLSDHPEMAVPLGEQLREAQLAEALEENARLKERVALDDTEREYRRQSLANEIRETLKVRGHFAAERPSDLIGCVARAIESERDRANLAEAELTAERERANRLQIAVDGAAGLLTYAAYGADRCCNRPCSEVEEMVRRSTQMRAWVLKYGKWKMGIAHPETEAEISISIDAARRK